MARWANDATCIGMVCVACKRNDDGRVVSRWTRPRLKGFSLLRCICSACDSEWVTWPWLESHTGLAWRRIARRTLRGFDVEEQAELIVLAHRWEQGVRG